MEYGQEEVIVDNMASWDCSVYMDWTLFCNIQRYRVITSIFLEIYRQFDVWLD